jgi:hypothetical protein
MNLTEISPLFIASKRSTDSLSYEFDPLFAIGTGPAAPEVETGRTTAANIANLYAQLT